jgi:hypothetical protein
MRAVGRRMIVREELYLMDRLNDVLCGSRVF